LGKSKKGGLGGTLSGCLCGLAKRFRGGFLVLGRVARARRGVSPRAGALLDGCLGKKKDTAFVYSRIFRAPPWTPVHRLVLRCAFFCSASVNFLALGEPVIFFLSTSQSLTGWRRTTRTSRAGGLQCESRSFVRSGLA